MQKILIIYSCVKLHKCYVLTI